MKGLIGKKVGMTQVYDENGVLIPVTVIEAGPCVVTDVKTSERDGYTAIQLGYGQRKAKNVTKARAGHLAKAGLTGDKLPSVLREVRISEKDEVPALGTELKADIFEANEYLDVVTWTEDEYNQMTESLGMMNIFDPEDFETVIGALTGYLIA